MFKWKKKTKTTVSIQDQIASGSKTLAELQQEIDLKHLENQVTRETQETRDHSNLVDLRKNWGKVILGILIATIIFNFFLVTMVGTGVWKFENNGTFLNVVATQNLAEIVGLVAIVLKSLFGEKKP